MWAFRIKAVEAALTGIGNTQKEIAAAAGVGETRASRWQRSAEFRAWMGRAFDDGFAVAIKRAGIALCRQAERGNVVAFNAVADRAERWGLIQMLAAPGSDPQTPAGALAIAGTHIHIHGIPEPAPRSTLPPVLELPASSGAPPQPK